MTLRPVYPRGKSSQYPLNRDLDGAQSRSERFRDEKKSHSPARNQTPYRPARTLVSSYRKYAYISYIFSELRQLFDNEV